MDVNQTRWTRSWVLIAVLAALSTGCASQDEPKSDPTRWDISDALPGAVRVKDVKQDIDNNWGPRSCSLGFYYWELVGAGNYNRKKVPFEFGKYQLKDVNVQYFVMWMDRTSRPPNYNPASYVIEDLGRCQAGTPEPGKDDYIYHFNLTPIGTPDSERFGWYETTVGPKRPPECDNKVHTTADGIGICPTPYQGTGMYTLIDGWILIGVDITTNNTSIDLKQVANVDTLLDALATRVKADPLTQHDYDHRKDR